MGGGVGSLAERWAVGERIEGMGVSRLEGENLGGKSGEEREESGAAATGEQFDDGGVVAAVEEVRTCSQQRADCGH